MKITEHLKKISFREGLFLIVMLAVIVWQIASCIQEPTKQTILFNGFESVVFFFVLCLCTTSDIPSPERAERMQIIAGLCLTLIYLVVLGELFYTAYTTHTVFSLIFWCTVLGISFGYALLLAIECMSFFQYEERRAEVVGGVRMVGAAHVRHGQLYVYDGLGKEPYWNKKLPERVDDYTEPRYVYADKFESVQPLSGHGRVIGYRISPTLVIHSMTVFDCQHLKQGILDFINEYGGKMLTKEDIPVLRQNWNAIDELRRAIGDTPLPKYIVPYAMPDHSVRATHIFDGRVFDKVDYGSIIMKR